MQQILTLLIVAWALTFANLSNAGGTLPEMSGGLSIDCSEATSRVEKRICANPELSALDLKLSEVYAEAQAEMAGVNGETGERNDPLAKEQKIWLRARDRCKSNACLHSAYIRRIKYIETHWLHR